MAAFRTLPRVFFTAAALAPLAAMSQYAGSANAAADSWFAPAGHSNLGLQATRSSFTLSCSNVAYLCDDKDRVAQLATGRSVPTPWGMEVAQVNLGAVSRFGSSTRAQGLNLSLIGKASLGHSLRVYGRAGTMWGRSESSNLAAGSGSAGSDQGFGFTYGAGVGYDITPRLSATLEWDSNDLRFASGTRDSVRSTSVGLQLRY
jgi:opacity protein-like surface antigen